MITDGVDNRFSSDPLRGPEGKDVAAVLNERFKDTGIQINFIAIPQSQPDLLQKLQDQFRGIESLPVAGRFYDANRPLDLVTSLRTVFRQELTYRVVRDDRRPIPGVSALDVTVSRLDADDIWCPWPLPPGGYRVQVNGDRPQEAGVALDGGDLLLLTLGDRGGVPTFGRGLFAQEFYPNQPSQTDRAFRWRLSALQNQLVENRGLRLLATLERLADESEGTLQLPRPRDVWFEVAPGEEAKGNVLLRWSNREGYPAPAWSLEVADWPRTLGTDEPARPVLRAWWREALSTPPADTLESVRQIDVRLPVDEDRKVELPGGTVVVRGVQVEEHEVEVAPGERRRMPCLVVRLSYPKGRPVWVRPRGVNAVGWEHRFYTSADSYTGLFWTETADEAFTTVDRLDLIGLDTFKRTCEGEGGYIELPLDAPRAGSTTPPPFDDRRPIPARLSPPAASGPGAPAMRTAVEFDFEARQERPIPLEDASRACAEGRFCWIDLDADADRDEARDALLGLGVDAAAVGRALAGFDDGRHDFLDDVVHVTVSAAELSGGALVTSPVDLVIGRSFLVSLHRGDPEFLEQVRRSYRLDFQSFARSPGFLLYEFWDHLIASYKAATRGLCDRVRGLQHGIFGATGDAIFARVAAVSDDLLSLRRVVLAAREVLSELCNRRSTAVAETTRPFLEKMVGTLERVVADLTVERETVAEALNLYLAVVSYKTNQVVNRLTVVSLVFLPLTFLCGVYGMNFKYLPEVEWRHGYILFWVSAAAVAAVTLGVMKRQGWW